MTEAAAPPPFAIAGHTVAPGTREFFDLELARLPTGTGLAVPVCVIHGASSGPALWINAAIHGDEINGVEITRRLIEQLKPRKLAGTLVAVPIVNVFGFINQSRYLPDRRDLNREFPGSPRGSLAARLADLFLNEIVVHCQYGIDMHTGANHRHNLPQIRADFRDAETRALAEAFAPPVIIQAENKDGSLREAAVKMGRRVLLYEGGEPSRFNGDAIEVGVRGVLRVMQHLGMLDAPKASGKPVAPPLYAEKTSWLRAKRSGILRLHADVGARVEAGEAVGVISDAFGRENIALKTPISGVITGITKLPLVNQGDAVARVAAVGPIPAGTKPLKRASKNTIFLQR